MELVVFWVLVFVVVAVWLGRRYGSPPVVKAMPARPAREVDHGLAELYRAGLAEGYGAAWADIGPVEKDRFRAYVQRARTVTVVYAVIGSAGVALIWWFWVVPVGAWVEVLRARPWWHLALVATGAIIWALGLWSAWPRWPTRSLAHQRGPEGIRTLLDERLLMADAHPSDVALRSVAAVRERMDAFVVRERESAWAAAERVGYERGHAEGFHSGRAEGVTRGRAEGLKQGRSEGLEPGRADGLERGRAEGVVRGRAEGYEQGRAEGTVQGRAEGLEVGQSQAREQARRQADVAVPAAVLAPVSVADVALRERLAYARGIEAGFELGRGSSQVITGLPLLDWWGHHPSLGWLYVDREALAAQDGPNGNLRAYALERDRVVDLPRAVWELSCRSAIDVLSGIDDAGKQRILEGKLLEHLRNRDRYAAAVRRPPAPSCPLG